MTLTNLFCFGFCNLRKPENPTHYSTVFGQQTVSFFLPVCQSKRGDGAFFVGRLGKIASTLRWFSVESNWYITIVFIRAIFFEVDDCNNEVLWRSIVAHSNASVNIQTMGIAQVNNFQKWTLIKPHDFNDFIGSVPKQFDNDFDNLLKTVSTDKVFLDRRVQM